MRVGVIGGTGFAQEEHARPETVETPYGAVTVQHGVLAGRDTVFLHRHGRGHALPPHRINHRANLWALADAGCERVIATASTGSLRREVGPGTLVIPDDYIDFSGRADRSFFDDAPVHVDVTEPYCPEVRAALLTGANAAGATARDGGVYVAMPGPRLETPAEVRFLAPHGDVVGMTGCPEAALAREKGLCYATFAVVANYAAGLPGEPLSAREIADASREALARLVPALEAAARALPEARACRCAMALEDARI